jgi:LDH2 family malate/lactate/ureidoglycolate dehydrogenase
VRRLYVPGERAWEVEQRHRAQGIPLPYATVQSLVRAATAAGLDSSDVHARLSPA